MKIKKKLEFENYGIVQMKKRAEKLDEAQEDEDEIINKPEKKVINEENRKMATEFCPDFKQNGFCYNHHCDKAHNRYEFDPRFLEDLVSDKMRLRQLQTSIKVGTEKILESKTTKPWMHTGKKVKFFSNIRILWKMHLMLDI